MSSRIPASLAALFFFASLPPALPAGTFEIMSVSAVRKTETQYSVGVEVPAMAQYVGPVDPSDDGYLLQTFLNDALGGDLNDWNNPDSFGDGISGTGISEGQILSCSGSCAAFMYVPKPFCPDGNSYRGKAGVTIYHQFTPEIDIEYTYVYGTGCYTDTSGGGGGGGGSPGCNSATLSTTTSSTLLSVDDGATLSSSTGHFTLARHDAQRGITYLLEEWAILRPGRGVGLSRDVDTLNASSPGFAAAAATRVRTSQLVLPDRPVLVLESVNHPLNDRYIPTPTVHLAAASSQGTPPGAGRVVVRADFAESGTLGALDVLYSSEPVPDQVLDEVRSRLEIHYQTAGRHRAVAFLVLGFGDGPVQELESQTVLPACCCGVNEAFCV